MRNFLPCRGPVCRIPPPSSTLHPLSAAASRRRRCRPDPFPPLLRRITESLPEEPRRDPEIITYAQRHRDRILRRHLRIFRQEDPHELVRFLVVVLDPPVQANVYRH